MIIRKKVPLLFILKEIKYPLIIVVIIAILADTLPLLVDKQLLPDIPISIATTLGIAISVLLSFKISQSYGRWWEARQIWGAIVNDSRTLVLQLKMYVENENAFIKKIAYRQIAWCYGLSRTLRKQDPIKDISGLVPSEELEQLENQRNIPLKVLDFQFGDVKELSSTDNLSKFSRIQIEETLSRLTASMGKCERIKNTVFPTHYSLTLYTAIYLFVIFLAISEPFKLDIILEVIILVLISTVFFSLEKAAFRLQDPFENKPTDTAMTSIARTIDINIRQILDEEELPEAIEPEKFFLL